MSDYFNDPAYPARPQHPDFWRLVEVITQLDGAVTEGGKAPQEILAADVDLDSLMYLIQQRVLRVTMAAPALQSVEPALMAVYLEAFALGTRFAQRGGHTDLEQQ